MKPFATILASCFTLLMLAQGFAWVHRPGCFCLCLMSAGGFAFLVSKIQKWTL